MHKTPENLVTREVVVQLGKGQSQSQRFCKFGAVDAALLVLVLNPMNPWGPTSASGQANQDNGCFLL